MVLGSRFLGRLLLNAFPLYVVVTVGLTGSAFRMGSLQLVVILVSPSLLKMRTRLL